ncbi:hypothetical protein ABFZ85_01990 [Hyphococcus formosus]|uniref:hypothetical protein n=1 Tax=Hyphococcus formosus TaxID=3143534 RepID=UPI00398B45C4
MTITLLHQGFDGLDFSVRTNMEIAYAKRFEMAREHAAIKREPQLIVIKDIAMHVSDHGARGGYKYVCDTGPLGASWFFKSPTTKDPWGVRVSLKSLTLALIGLENGVQEIFRVLQVLCDDVDNAKVSLGRIDYALDFLIPNFDLNPEQFVMHSRLTRSDDREASEVGRSGRVYSVRIGKMPGQQVAVYDKRADVLAKSKKVWWEIWNANLLALSMPPISPSNTKNSLWRVEFRAGKNFLKKQKSVTTIEEFLSVGGTLYSEMAEGIRYVSPGDDSNRARWPEHPLWFEVQSRLATGLPEMTDALPVSRVREIARADLIDLLDKQILGCEATLIAARDLDDLEFCDIMRFVSENRQKIISDDPNRFLQKIYQAKERYHFI